MLSDLLKNWTKGKVYIVFSRYNKSQEILRLHWKPEA